MLICSSMEDVTEGLVCNAWSTSVRPRGIFQTYEFMPSRERVRIFLRDTWRDDGDLVQGWRSEECRVVGRYQIGKDY